jgi:hypothetical protein
VPKNGLITRTLLKQLGEELRQEIFYDTGILIGEKEMSFDISGDIITAKLWGYDLGNIKYGEEEIYAGFDPSDLAVMMIDSIEDMEKNIIESKMKDIEKHGLPGLKTDIITILEHNGVKPEVIDGLNFSIKDLGYGNLDFVDIAEGQGYPLIVIAIWDGKTIDFNYPLSLGTDHLVDDLNDLVFRLIDEMVKVEMMDE